MSLDLKDFVTNLRSKIGRNTILMTALQKRRRREIGLRFGNAITKATDKDMVRERVKNQVPYPEYFLFGFPDLNSNQRKEFVSDVQRMNYINKMNSNCRNEHLFSNKFETYEYFKPFFNRELFKVDSSTTIDRLIEFFLKTPTAIFKPIDSSFGRGVERVSFNPSEDINSAVTAWCGRVRNQYPRGGVLEEYILQTEELAVIHPQSLNTIRVPTIRISDTDIRIFHPFIRFGVGDSIIDNAGGGGLICALDSETGTILAVCDECGKRYRKHPDSGIDLDGLVIPRWREVITFAKELARFSPVGTNYVGWDIALCDDGCKLVEGNSK